MIRMRGRNITELLLCPSQCNTSGGCGVNMSHCWLCWPWSLDKMVSTRFFHCTVSPFVMSKYLVGRSFWDFANILFHIIPQLRLFCIHPWSIRVMCAKWSFSIPVTPFSFHDWNSTIRKSYPLSSISLFVNYVFVSIWTCGYLFYSVGHNLLSSLFVFFCKLPQIWSLEAPSSWCLCPSLTILLL